MINGISRTSKINTTYKKVFDEEMEDYEEEY